MFDFKQDNGLTLDDSSNIDFNDPNALDQYPYLKELYESGTPIKIIAARVLQHAWIKQVHYVTFSAASLRKVMAALPEKYKLRLSLAGGGYTRSKQLLIDSGVIELVQKTLEYKQGRKALQDLFRLTPTAIKLIGISPERQAEVQQVADNHLNAMLSQAARTGLPAEEKVSPQVVISGSRKFVPKRMEQ